MKTDTNFFTRRYRAEDTRHNNFIVLLSRCLSFRYELSLREFGGLFKIAKGTITSRGKITLLFIIARENVLLRSIRMINQQDRPLCLLLEAYMRSSNYTMLFY